jgi:hypothetical protein
MSPVVELNFQTSFGLGAEYPQHVANHSMCKTDEVFSLSSILAPFMQMNNTHKLIIIK